MSQLAKTIVIFTLILFPSFAKVITINVDTAYSSGDLLIEEVHGIDDSFENNDTLLFSNGTMITFASVFGMHQGYGGLMILDSTSTLTFKGSGKQEQQGNFFGSVTKNKTLEQWYETTSLPESTFTADPFQMDFDNNTHQASYFIHSSGGETTPYIDRNLTEDFAAINYISTGNSNIKLQLYNCDEYEGSGEYMDGNDVSNFMIRWAVDSVGNGIFKHTLPNPLIEEYDFKHNQFGGEFSFEFIHDSIQTYVPTQFVEFISLPSLTDEHCFSKASVTKYNKIKYEIEGVGFDKYVDSLSYLVKTRHYMDSTIQTNFVKTYIHLELYTDKLLNTCSNAKGKQLLVETSPKQVQIQLKGQQPINSVLLFSLNGQVVLEYTPQCGQQQFTIPLESPLSKGPYILSLWTKEKQYLKKLLIK